MRRRWTNFCLMWLGGALLCAATSFVVATEPASVDQLASDALQAGIARDSSAVKSLIASLSHESVVVRQSSAWALSQVGESAIEAVSSLTHALGDTDPRVRWASAVALGQIGRKAANSESALWQTTHDRDLDVRCAALTALRAVSVSKSSGALPALIDCLRNPAADVQAEAIATFTAIHARWDDDEKRPIAMQLSNMLTTSDDNLRLAAAVLLGDLGLSASAAVTSLAEATDNTEPHLQAAALRAVARFADAIDQRWNRMSAEQRRELRPALVAATSLLESRRQKSGDIAQLADQYQRLIDGTQLISNGPLAQAEVPLAKPKSGHSNEALRAESASSSTSWKNWRWICGALLMCVGAWGLWHGLAGASLRMSPANTHMVEIPQTSQGPVLEVTPTAAAEVAASWRHVTNDNHRVGELSPSAIANPSCSDDKSIVCPLPERTVEDSGREVMEVVPQLIAALVAEDSRVRAAAALVLAAFGTQWQEGDSSAEEIVRLVSDPDVSMRSNIATALGGIGTDAADVSPAERSASIDHKDGVVLAASITAAPSADGEPSTASSNPVSPVLKLFSPNQTDEPAVTEMAEQPLEAADFIAKLEDADGEVRWRAQQALQELGAAAIPELMASLNHRNPAVRKSVIVALGRVGGEASSAMPAMLVALHDVNADVRGAAADCLGRLGVVNQSMLQTLVKTLNDPNAEVRRYAATTLGRIGPQACAATTALRIAAISDIAVKVRSAAQAALQRIFKPQVEAA